MHKLSKLKRKILPNCLEGKYVQLNPGNSNYQGKLQLLRVIEVSSDRGFEQKNQKHLIKVV